MKFFKWKDFGDNINKLFCTYESMNLHEPSDFKQVNQRAAFIMLIGL